MKVIIITLASVFGFGYLPLISGTWGTGASAILLWYLNPDNPVISLLLFICVLIISVPVCGKAEKLYGKKDDGRIVLDELVGFWVSILFLPKSLVIFAIAFLFFRIFDIIKPFFIRKIQNWRGGYGVVADDFFAGLLTNILLQILTRVWDFS